MRHVPVQTSLWDIYDDVSHSMKQQKPQLITLLEKHSHFEQLIPLEFRWAYYSRMERNPVYHLESILRAFVLQKILSIPTDSLLLSLLHCCKEFQDFCGFRKIPDASKSYPVSRNNTRITCAQGPSERFLTETVL